MQTESGVMVAGKLTLHAQRLGPAGLADKFSDAKQLMLADQTETGTAAQLHGAHTGDAPGTCKPVQDQPGLGTSGQPLQSVELLAAKGEHNGQVSRKILEKFANISSYTRAATRLLLCIKKNAQEGGTPWTSLSNSPGGLPLLCICFFKNVAGR